MQKPNLIIKKGAILAYRLYDIAHEIDLKAAQAQLEQVKSSKDIRRYQLNKDPLRAVTFRAPPLTMTGEDSEIQIRLQNNELKAYKVSLEVKIWDYGVISFAYRLDLPPDLKWKELVILGSILDSDSPIDDLAKRKREEIVGQLSSALKNPYSHSVFEDYTTYLIEEVEEHINPNKEDAEVKLPMTVTKFKDPIEVIKKASVAELLLAEPNRVLAESTRKSVQSTYSQYTKKDLLILDWNSALVLDFTKEKEYQDYVDVIEFSLAQLLELRIYDQLLDEKLDELYNSMEKKDYMKITDFYSGMSEESTRMFMEFSDVFEKLDNSIKTVGDFYLAKVLKAADKKFGFEELKKSMSRKIDALADITRIFQDKIDSLIEEKRNQDSQHHSRTSLFMEIIVVILISIEVIPVLYNHRQDMWNWVVNFYHFINNLI